VSVKTTEQEALAFCVPVEDLRAALANVAGQTAADSAKVRSRHRVLHAVKRLGVAGAVYCSAIESAAMAAAGVLTAEAREKVARLEAALPGRDAALFAGIPPEV